MHRVLIVDDYEMIRGVMGEYLVQNIPELEIVGEAANGQEAIELAERVNPELILMDVRMPVVNGIQATLEIKARHPEIEVITYSGSRDEDLQRQSLMAGAAAHFAKPFDLKFLQEKVLELLAGKKHQKANCL